MSLSIVMLNQISEKKLIRKNYVSNQYRIASISYSLVACFLGLVTATLEPLKTCNFT
jgi:hypothetical protein